MKKNNLTHGIVAITIFTILYYLWLVLTKGDMQLLGGITISILGGEIASILLFKTYSKVKNNKEFWLLIFISVMCNTSADFIWVLYEKVLTKDIIGQIIPTVLYTFSNLSLCLSIFIIVYKQKSKWNMLQLLIDTIAVGSAYTYLGWILFLRNIIPNIQSVTFDEWITLIYVILDLLLIIGMSILFLSSKKEFFNTKTFLINFFGIGIFAIADLYYSHEVFNKIYNDSSLVDPLWCAAFLIMALSGLFEEHLAKESFQSENKKGILPINLKKEISYVITIPVILILVLDSSRGKNGLLGLLLLVGHRIISRHIIISVENEQLLIEQKELNESLQLKFREGEFLNNSLQSKIKEINDLNGGLEKKIEKRTLELSIKNKELEVLSKEDSLTGIPNRRHFLDILDNLILNDSNGKMIGIMFIDLDRFKAINDWYGHDIGDDLLKEISKRLKEMLPKNAFLARLGGDEFVVLLKNIEGKEEVRVLAIKIKEMFVEPLNIDKYEIFITCSIGIVIFPNDGEERTTLMKNADIAMYRAKDLGKNNFEFYDNKFKSEVSKKLQMENLLKNADFDKEFVLYYQPQIDLKTEEICGAEALIRWDNPTLGFISPGEFISLAEEMGIIEEIGEWVLEKSCFQLKQWEENFNVSLKVGVNISAKHFINHNFVKNVIKNIDRNHISPKCLDLEITEEIAMGHEEYIIDKLTKLKAIGVKVSIDDFGTGYSSLSYLKQFSVDTLKIAMPFIKGIDDNEKDYQIVKAIIKMAQSLNMRVIAEGVEEESQINILKELNCDEVQGYFYGKPMTVKDLEEKYLKKLKFNI